jgi:hypothetical protein
MLVGALARRWLIRGPCFCISGTLLFSGIVDGQLWAAARQAGCSFFLIAVFLFSSGWRGPIKQPRSGVAFICYLSTHVWIWGGRGQGSRQAGRSSMTTLAGAGGRACRGIGVEDIRNGWRFTAGFDLVFYRVECLGFSSFGRDCLPSAL